MSFLRFIISNSTFVFLLKVSISILHLFIAYRYLHIDIWLSSMSCTYTPCSKLHILKPFWTKNLLIICSIIFGSASSHKESCDLYTTYPHFRWTQNPMVCWKNSFFFNFPFKNENLASKWNNANSYYKLIHRKALLSHV